MMRFFVGVSFALVIPSNGCYAAYTAPKGNTLDYPSQAMLVVEGPNSQI